MRWLLTFILLAQVMIVCSQSNSVPENGVGLNLTSSDFDGLGLSVRLTKNMKSGGILKFELNSNFKRSNNLRIGYEILQMRWGKLELGLGLDLKYGRIDITILNFSSHSYVSIQLPIEFRYQFNPSYSIFSGISYSKKIWSNTALLHFGTSPEFRVGMMYNY